MNAVCPGLIDTEMVRATIDDERTAAYERSFPIPRLGLPEEVAELVAFLASDRAAYITGASLDINGGDLMISGECLPRKSSPTNPISPIVKRVDQRNSMVMDEIAEEVGKRFSQLTGLDQGQ